jgi:hypothetical protein
LCDQNEKNEKGGACSTYGEGFGVYRGKPEGKSPFGRPRGSWEDNEKVDLQGWDVGAWTGLIWLRTGTGGGLL